MHVIDLDAPPSSSPGRRSRPWSILIVVALGLGSLTGEPAGFPQLDPVAVCGSPAGKSDHAANPAAIRRVEIAIDSQTGHIRWVRCGTFQPNAEG